MAKEKRKPLKIGGTVVSAGSRETVDLMIARLYTHSEVTMPVHIIHGRREGPVLFVSAAIHGDELNGVEIIRRVLQMSSLRSLRGSLVAVPIVNVYGLLNQSRYLPDRRDLNRSFPGSSSGSLASQISHLFMNEVVAKCTHGIDLHTGSNHRTNLPQVRACLDDKTTARLATVFGAPVVIDANVRDGSLRQAVYEKSMPMLLYEAGEAMRFNELAIRIGVRGIVKVMRELGMLPAGKRKPGREPVVARRSGWVRAPRSGVVRFIAKLGAQVEEGETLAWISDPFGENEEPLPARTGGLIIGKSQLPLVYRGDALYHLAQFAADQDVDVALEALTEEDMQPGPILL